MNKGVFPQFAAGVLSALFVLASAPVSAADEPLHWATPCPDRSATMGHLLEAVSGHENKPDLEQLITGVVTIVREDNQYRFVRSDGEQLLVPRSTDMGERMFSCMEKVERQARKRIGDGAADYVRSLDSLIVTGDTVELHHAGDESVLVPLPTNQPWLPVKLKELHLKNIRLQLVESDRPDAPHKIKSIDGIAAVVESAGIDVSVEPREFWRYRDKEGDTHLVLGIKSLIPSPVRFVFHLPDIMHVHFEVKKKKED